MHSIQFIEVFSALPVYCLDTQLRRLQINSLTLTDAFCTFFQGTDDAHAKTAIGSQDQVRAASDYDAPFGGDIQYHLYQVLEVALLGIRPALEQGLPPVTVYAVDPVIKSPYEIHINVGPLGDLLKNETIATAHPQRIGQLLCRLLAKRPVTARHRHYVRGPQLSSSAILHRLAFPGHLRGDQRLDQAFYTAFHAWL